MPKKLLFNALSGNFDIVSEVALTAAGSTPAPEGASIDAGQYLTLQPADASNPGIVSTTAQDFSGDKTFTDTIFADGTIDVTATGGSDVLTIGGTNADIINIGRSGASINVQGTTFYQDVVNLNVTDKLITVNDGGSAGSGGGSGIEIEEDAIITGYEKTSADRNSWELKAPNTAGVATITPGASGITLDQSSHNPISLAAVGASPNANGASLSGQVLNLEPADNTTPGVLTASAQAIGGVKTFSSAPNITALTASQTVVTDGSKNLASLAYTPVNTVSTIVSRDGSGDFAAGTITAALTGAASNNVLKAGDTMTGPLNMPAGSASVAELTGGTANTGFFFPTSATAAFTSGGTEVARLGAKGLTIGNTTAQTKALYIKPSSGSLGIQLENINNTRKFNIDLSSANFTLLGQDGTDGMLSISNTATGGSGTNWWSMGGNGTANPPLYPMGFECISADGNITSLSSIISGNGNNVNGSPWVVLRNKNGTANTIAGWVTTGTSSNPMSFAGTVHKTQTATAEASDYIIATQKGGTLTEGLRLTDQQALKLPAYTTAGILTNDSSGNITSITNPASTGDINQTSFSAANNQVAAANVTGLAFANGSVRSFEAQVSVTVEATANLYEAFTLVGIQRGADWVMAQTAAGDSSGFVFTITTAGQIQYTNNNYAGFTSAIVKYRAKVLNV